MPSPDVSQYVDLTLFDLSAQQVFLDALRHARIALPEFQPVEGAIETVLLEAMAIEVQALVTAINRLPAGILQALLGFLGIPRIDASPSTALVKITSSQTAESIVPVGVRYIARVSAASAPIALETTEAIALTRKRYIASISRASNVATVTTSTYHGLTNGQVVTITIDPDATGDTDFDGSATVTVSDEATFTYPNTGADVALTDASSTASYALVAADLSPYGFGQVAASVPGYTYVPIATPLTLLTSVTQIASTTLATNLDGGFDAESDSDFFQRASSSLNRMTAALVTAEQISQYIASRPEFRYVYRIKTIDNCDSTRALNMPGNALIVAARIGASPDVQIDTASFTDITDGIAPYIHPALTVAAENALLIKVNVAVTVKAVEGVSAGQVTSAITSALDAYLSSDSWNWSDTVRVNEIAHVVRTATYNGTPVVAYVSDLSLTPVAGNFDTVTLAGASTFSASVRSSNVLTVTTADTLPVDDSTTSSYVALRMSTEDAYTLYLVQTVGSGEFTINQTGANATGLSGDWATVVFHDNGLGESGDLRINDPAPLTMSGIHTITID